MTDLHLNPAGYVVEDGLAIYGTGQTQSGAVADARSWLDSKRAHEPIKRGVSKIEGVLCVAPATAALIAQVESHGGDVAWGIWDGVLGTEDEVDKLFAERWG